MQDLYQTLIKELLLILKEVNNLNKQYKVEGMIKVQLKYIKKAQRVNLIVKYKAITVPINIFTNTKHAKIAAFIQVVL